MKWDMDVGSVIVVRKDKKPITPVQMKAVAFYCRDEVQPVLSHTMGTYNEDKPMTKEQALSIIYRPMFEIHWRKFISDRDVPNLFGLVW
jgi:Cu2+-containing amine oxidase